jgi:hypothetical protein
MTRADSVHSTPPTNTPTDPIYAAIAVHQKAYAEYDKTVTDSAPNDENRAAFRALDKACRRLVLAETSTMAGLIALLRHMAPLLQEEDAPALPLEVQFDNRWETAFGTFCANVAERLTAIATKDAAVTPDHVDHVAETIVTATGDLFDDFEMARTAARAAIDAIEKAALDDARHRSAGT